MFEVLARTNLKVKHESTNGNFKYMKIVIKSFARFHSLSVFRGYYMMHT